MNVYIYEEFELDNKTKEELINLGYSIKYFSKDGIENIEDVDVYVGYPSKYLSKNLLPNVKYIQLCSSGFDDINIADYKERGVNISNARGVHSIPIAEYVLMHILSAFKEYDLFKSRQEKGGWNKECNVVTLEDMKVLILGTGSIGQEIAKRCKSFAMEITGFNSNGRSVEYFDSCISDSQLASTISKSDIVINALPLNNNTRHLVNDKLLQHFKNNSVFINIGRGQTVDTQALVNNSDKFNRIILDVFETEPLPTESELWKHPKFIITPHSSFHSNKTKEKICNLAYNNLIAYIKGKELENLL